MLLNLIVSLLTVLRAVDFGQCWKCRINVVFIALYLTGLFNWPLETETREDEFVVRVDERRPQAKEEVKVEKQDEDFFDLIDQLDKYSESKQAQTVTREGTPICNLSTSTGSL